MKVLVLKASPKKDGNTATMADRFVAGLSDVGHTDIVEFRLNDLTIRPCQACDRCFQPPYSGCVLDDDFMTIYPEFRGADLIVFAAPVYWWHLCAQMKTFVDRMHPMLTFDRGHCLPSKDLVLITAYFAEDPYGVELVIRTFESISGWAGMGFDVVRFHSATGPRQASRLAEEASPRAESSPDPQTEEAISDEVGSVAAVDKVPAKEGGCGTLHRRRRSKIMAFTEGRCIDLTRLTLACEAHEQTALRSGQRVPLGGVGLALALQ